MYVYVCVCVYIYIYIYIYLKEGNLDGPVSCLAPDRERTNTLRNLRCTIAGQVCTVTTAVQSMFECCGVVIYTLVSFS